MTATGATATNIERKSFTIRRILRIIYWSMLCLWFGGLLMTGAVAAIIFPTMKHLDPTLPSFAQYTVPHSHWAIAAGEVMNMVFLFTDFISLIGVAVVIVVLTIEYAWLKIIRPSASTFLRLAALFALIILVGYQVLYLGPRMTNNLTEFWTDAQQGEIAKADAFKAAFDKDHPQATNIFAGITIALALLVGASAASTVQLSEQLPEEGSAFAVVSGPRPNSSGSKRHRAKLEEPDLVHKKMGMP